MRLFSRLHDPNRAGEEDVKLPDIGGQERRVKQLRLVDAVGLRQQSVESIQVPVYTLGKGAVAGVKIRHGRRASWRVATEQAAH